MCSTMSSGLFLSTCDLATKYAYIHSKSRKRRYPTYDCGIVASVDNVNHLN